MLLACALMVAGWLAAHPAGASAAIEVTGPAPPLREGVAYELRIRNTEKTPISLEASAGFPGQFGMFSKESKGSSWSLFGTTCPICLVPGAECAQGFGYLGGQPAKADWTIKYKTACAEGEEEQEKGKGKKPKVHERTHKTRFG